MRYLSKPAAANQSKLKDHQEILALLTGCLLIFLWYSKELMVWMESGTSYAQVFSALLGLLCICIYLGQRIKAYRSDGIGGRDLRANLLLHNLLLALTAFFSYLGFSPIIEPTLGEDSNAALGLALLLFTLANMFTHHLLHESGFKWLLTVIVIFFLFCISSLSNTAALFPYLGYQNLLAAQRTAGIEGLYQVSEHVVTQIDLMVQKQKLLADYSRQRAKEENSSGGTCEAHIKGSKTGGPRADLRNHDAKRLNQFSLQGEALLEQLNDWSVTTAAISKLHDPTEIQLQLDQQYQRLNPLLTSAKALTASQIPYLRSRIKLGKEGWIYKYVEDENNKKVPYKAYCIDPDFDQQAEALITESEKVNTLKPPQQTAILKLGSDVQENSAKTIRFIWQKASEGDYEPLKYLRVPFVFGSGLDIMILIFAYILLGRSGRPLHNFCHDLALEHFYPEDNTIRFIPQQVPLLFRNMERLVSHRLASVKHQDGVAIYKLSPKLKGEIG